MCIVLYCIKQPWPYQLFFFKNSCESNVSASLIFVLLHFLRWNSKETTWQRRATQIASSIAECLSILRPFIVSYVQNEWCWNLIMFTLKLDESHKARRRCSAAVRCQQIGRTWNICPRTKWSPRSLSDFARAKSRHGGTKVKVKGHKFRAQKEMLAESFESWGPSCFVDIHWDWRTTKRWAKRNLHGIVANCIRNVWDCV